VPAFERIIHSRAAGAAAVAGASGTGRGAYARASVPAASLPPPAWGDVAAAGRGCGKGAFCRRPRGGRDTDDVVAAPGSGVMILTGGGRGSARKIGVGRLCRSAPPGNKGRNRRGPQALAAHSMFAAYSRDHNVIGPLVPCWSRSGGDPPNTWKAAQSDGVQ